MDGNFTTSSSTATTDTNSNDPFPFTSRLLTHPPLFANLSTLFSLFPSGQSNNPHVQRKLSLSRLVCLIASPVGTLQHGRSSFLCDVQLSHAHTHRHRKIQLSLKTRPPLTITTLENYPISFPLLDSSTPSFLIPSV